MAILVTGAAGFIGFHLCERLLIEGHKVVGIDNLNAYYDPNLKLDRIKKIQKLGQTLNFLVQFYCPGFVFFLSVSAAIPSAQLSRRPQPSRRSLSPRPLSHPLEIHRPRPRLPG